MPTLLPSKKLPEVAGLGKEGSIMVFAVLTETQIEPVKAHDNLFHRLQLLRIQAGKDPDLNNRCHAALVTFCLSFSIASSAYSFLFFT